MDEFCGMSQAWLETEYERAMSDLRAGGPITGTTSGDVSVQRGGGSSSAAGSVYIRKLLRALYLKDPAKWTFGNCIPKSEVRLTARGIATQSDIPIA